MGPEALRRIRWSNVGRLAGGLAVIAAVVAWPRLAPPQPALPSEVARPLDGLGIDPAATPPAELLVPRPRKPRQRTRGSERRARETGRGRSATGDARERRKRRARRTTGAGERRRSEVQTRPDPGSVGREEGGGLPGSRERASGGQRPDPPAAADRPAAATPDEDPAQTEFGFEEGG
jgi:hypothetical protein